jgi:hypothetical protein
MNSTKIAFTNIQEQIKTSMKEIKELKKRTKIERI